MRPIAQAQPKKLKRKAQYEEPETQEQPQAEGQTQTHAQPRAQAQPKTQVQARKKPQVQMQPQTQTQAQPQIQTQVQPQLQPPSLVEPNITPPPAPHKRLKQMKAQEQPKTQGQPQAQAQPQLQPPSLVEPNITPPPAPHKLKQTKAQEQPPKTQGQPHAQAKPRAQAQPQLQPPSLVESNTTPPPAPHDNPDLEQPMAIGTDEAECVTPTLTTFLDKADPTPLGFLAKDLQKVGVLTVAELKLIARKPEAFREVIPALADLRKSEQFLWFTFRTTLGRLLEEDQRRGLADGLAPGDDPIGKFVQSLGGGEWIDSGTFAGDLRRTGISSERDLMVLSRNLEKYTERIPFLREFAATNKFGWVIFQVGLSGLSGQRASTSIRAQDYGTDREGEPYIKWFLDTIDSTKPLGHLAKGFTEAGVTNYIRLHSVAVNIEVAVDSMPFFQDLATGDQLVWAMISAGLDNLCKSA